MQQRSDRGYSTGVATMAEGVMLFMAIIGIVAYVFFG